MNRTEKILLYIYSSQGEPFGISEQNVVTNYDDDDDSEDDDHDNDACPFIISTVNSFKKCTVFVCIVNLGSLYVARTWSTQRHKYSHAYLYEIKQCHALEIKN